jgi:hypothetical protein
MVLLHIYYLLYVFWIPAQVGDDNESGSRTAQLVIPDLSGDPGEASINLIVQ